MAQYFDDFSGYADGTLSDAAWTILSTETVTLNIATRGWESSGKSAKITMSNSDAPIIVWSPASASQFEVYMRVKWVGADLSGERRFGLYGRVSTSGIAFDNALGVRIQSGSTCSTYRITSGTGSTRDTVGSLTPAYVEDDIVNFVIGYDGTNVYARWWLDGSSDPVTNIYTYAIVNDFESGPIAMTMYTAAVHAIEFDCFGLGTEGSPAPQSTLATAPAISSVSKVEAGQALTITGTTFETVKGTTGRVLISPTDLSSDLDAAEQTITGAEKWSDTSITVDSVILPGSVDPGGTAYLFIRNDSNEENSAGYALTVADMCLRVGSGTLADTLKDTDTGVDIASEALARMVVLSGAAGSTTIVAEYVDATITAGVLEYEDTLYNITTEDDTFLVAIEGASANRYGLLPAIVVDRNEDP